MKLLSKVILNLATKEYRKLVNNPSFYGPKEEPFKKYIYDKTNTNDGPVPYKTEWPNKPGAKVKRQMKKESFRYFFLEKALKTRRATAGKGTDPEIDDYLIGMVSHRAFGFGL